jgi:acetyl-CoA/propionyl-CoA carboxylase biotin carboxyl carrier protein
VVVEVEGKRIEVSIPARFLHTGTGSPTAGRAPKRKVSAHHASAGASESVIKAPMQSTVVKIAVSVGDKIVEGDQVIVLEAMKMEQSITSPRNGVIKEIKVSVGDTIASGSALLEFED